MSPRAATTPDADTGANGLPAQSSAGAGPITLSQLLARGAVYEGRSVHRIVLHFDGGEMSADLPTPPDSANADSLRAEILSVLGKLKPGEWMKGRNVAWEIDENLDHNSGSFRRAIQRLRDTDRIESGPDGYRLRVRT